MTNRDRAIEAARVALREAWDLSDAGAVDGGLLDDLDAAISLPTSPPVPVSERMLARERALVRETLRRSAILGDDVARDLHDDAIIAAVDRTHPRGHVADLDEPSAAAAPPVYFADGTTERADVVYSRGYRAGRAEAEAARDTAGPPSEAVREWALTFAQEVVEETKRAHYEGGRLTLIGTAAVDAILSRIGPPPALSDAAAYERVIADLCALAESILTDPTMTHGVARLGTLDIAVRRIRALSTHPASPPVMTPREHALRCAYLARWEPALPVESVVFQASLPDRVIAPPASPPVPAPGMTDLMVPPESIAAEVPAPGETAAVVAGIVHTRSASASSPPPAPSAGPACLRAWGCR